MLQCGSFRMLTVKANSPVCLWYPCSTVATSTLAEAGEQLTSSLGAPCKQDGTKRQNRVNTRMGIQADVGEVARQPLEFMQFQAWVARH